MGRFCYTLREEFDLQFDPRRWTFVRIKGVNESIFGASRRAPSNCPLANGRAPVPPAETFTELLDRARSGDRDAMARLVQQYESKIRMVARVRLGAALRPYLDSLDLVQSVHRSLLGGLAKDKFDISTPEKLVALAVTMVRRKAARQWRHLQRQKRLEGGSSSTNLPSMLSALSSPGDEPEQAVQFNDQVEHLCANLSEADRNLLELRIQGYSLAETADALGLSQVALRVRLTRLRQRLRAARILDDWL
jgi:RNA polymerase sigma-70 factor (ECF subfamily)